MERADRKTILLVSTIGFLLLFAVLMAAIAVVPPADDKEPLPPGVAISLSTDEGPYTIADAIPLYANISNDADDEVSVSMELLQDWKLHFDGGGYSWHLGVFPLLNNASQKEWILSPGQTGVVFETMLPMGFLECTIGSPTQVRAELSDGSGISVSTTEFTVNPAEAPFIRVWSDKLFYHRGEGISLRFYLCNPTDSPVNIFTNSRPGWGFAIFNSTGVNLTLWPNSGHLLDIGSVAAPGNSEVPLSPGAHDTEVFDWTFDVERITVDGIEIIGSEYVWTQYSSSLESVVPTGLYNVKAKSFSLGGFPVLRGSTIIYVV